MERTFSLSFAFDDILIKPAASNIEPGEALVKTEAVRGLFLSLPILSAAMDRVTDERMAIALGKLGGLQVGMGYIVAKTIAEMPRKAKFIYVTKASVREGQPHDLDVIKTSQY